MKSLVGEVGEEGEVAGRRKGCRGVLEDSRGVHSTQLGEGRIWKCGFLNSQRKVKGEKVGVGAEG